MTTTDDYITAEQDDAERNADRQARERAELIAGLRAYADLLELHPNLPIPSYGVYATAYVDNATARAGREGIYGWRKDNVPASAYISYEKRLGDVFVQFQVSKYETCQRIPAGVKHIEATEAHDVDTFKWVCSPASDDSQP